MIPEHIKDLKFLKISGRSKRAFQDDWPNKPDLHMTYKEALAWLEQGNNYGVIRGPITGVGMIDCDCLSYVQAVENHLPPTFSVRSSSEKKRHFYYRFINFPTGETKFSLVDPDDLDDPKAQGGDIRCGNFYVVGPGSIHPDTGKPYEVIDNLPITTIDYKDVFEVFGPYYKKLAKKVPGFLERPDYPLSNMRVLEHYKIVVVPDKRGQQLYPRLT